MWYIHYWKAPRWTCSPPEVLSRVLLAWVRSQFSEGESFKQWHGDFQIRLQDENMSNVTLCMCVADYLLLMERSHILTVYGYSMFRMAHYHTIYCVCTTQFYAHRSSLQFTAAQNAKCSSWLSSSRVWWTSQSYQVILTTKHLQDECIYLRDWTNSKLWKPIFSKKTKQKKTCFGKSK